MLTTAKVIDPCVYCSNSTAFGSGNFVNRIGHDDGWACAMCAGYECDRCDKQIYLDEDYGINEEGHYHWECLTQEERKEHE
jgi:hypothetical protein